MVELMHVRATEVQVDLALAARRRHAGLVFDPEGIHRAVLNVVTNAIDAVSDCETPGRVEVATQYAAAGAVRITVDDNGPGIPADQMEHLFSPFVASKKSRGTGLGLPVSQKILREHGGQIVVHTSPAAAAASPSNCPPSCRRPAPTRHRTLRLRRRERNSEPYARTIALPSSDLLL